MHEQINLPDHYCSIHLDKNHSTQLNAIEQEQSQSDCQKC